MTQKSQKSIYFTDIAKSKKINEKEITKRKQKLHKFVTTDVQLQRNTSKK